MTKTALITGITRPRTASYHILFYCQLLLTRAIRCMASKRAGRQLNHPAAFDPPLPGIRSEGLIPALVLQLRAILHRFHQSDRIAASRAAAR